MDPQQKVALETVYRALEEGGFSQQRVSDTNTAVYMGEREPGARALVAAFICCWANRLKTVHVRLIAEDLL